MKLNTNEMPVPARARGWPRPCAGRSARTGASLRLYPDPRSARAAGRRRRAARARPRTTSASATGRTISSTCSCAASAGRRRRPAFTLPSYSLYPVLVGIQDGRAIGRGIRPDHAPAGGDDRGVCGAGLFPDLAQRPDGRRVPHAPRSRRSCGVPRHAGGGRGLAPFAGENAAGLVGAASEPCASCARFPRPMPLPECGSGYALAASRGHRLARPRARQLQRQPAVAGRRPRGAVAIPTTTRRWSAKVKATRERAYAGVDGRQRLVHLSLADQLSSSPSRGTARAAPARRWRGGLYDFLFSRKMLVRHFPSHALTASFLRISVGTDDEMLVLRTNP